MKVKNTLKVFLIIIVVQAMIISVIIWSWSESEIIYNINADFDQFFELGRQFAIEHEYSDKYNCMNYSKDFRNVAMGFNFSIDRVIGCPLNFTNSSDCHAFNLITFDYEPQDGLIKDYSKKYPLRRVKND